MLINISELDPGGLEIDTSVAVAPFTWEGEQTVTVTPVRFEGALRLLKGRYELRGAFATTAKLGCTRCLEPLEREIEGEFRLFLLPQALESMGRGADGGRRHDAAVDPEDDDAEDRYPLEGWTADLAELLREQIDLQLPLAVRCRDDCRGLCAGCGANLNEADCRCSRETDARWASLAEWRQRKDRE